VEDRGAAGRALQADDTIMVLESMKMEIPVVAPESGRWSKLLVAEVRRCARARTSRSSKR
jgi:biotin carboxyl carrier protein